MTDETTVMCCHELVASSLDVLAAKYSMTVQRLSPQQTIPGSYWGDREAGLKQHVLYVREDTPVHSALHELCHYVCMPSERRNALDTDAGGDYEEENGVCYLQILLADQVAPMSKPRLMQDMDDWGYTFRLGSAKAWFESDAEDARMWLKQFQLIDNHDQPTWKKRGEGYDAT